ncbi:hypothetical protein [Paraburkholderia kirstenboschensis]|uniref:Uncharacterized protein n=1 Tax=Paraburkholderia kirstenboschensis TaxID=1245436 RepID=A0ABZ0EL22_9BURK|nr:hypothetical protein [Paraburkholderia kirstenboschensis]WOD17286.1 hypothetical protein RW095_12870 [Paraburkholderia kirstenboschensis]
MPIASISKLMTTIVSLDSRRALNAPLDVTVGMGTSTNAPAHGLVSVPCCRAMTC